MARLSQTGLQLMVISRARHRGPSRGQEVLRSSSRFSTGESGRAPRELVAGHLPTAAGSVIALSCCSV